MEPGTTAFGRYVIDRELGHGGMGVVYLAKDLRLGRQVALKLLLPELAHRQDASAQVARLLREARAAASFQHPNAVVIYDVGEGDASPYIAMELVRGSSLRRMVGERAKSWQHKVRLLRDAARALAAAHRAGIIHRDVKPDNVLVTDDGEVKVVDFGIARAVSLEPADPVGPTESMRLGTLTAAGQIVGTPVYMSPEQLRSEHMDARTDQYSWGVMAWELLAGRLPWSGQGGLQVIVQVVSSEPPPLSSIAQDVPDEVCHVVARAMSKRAEDRYASLDEAADLLEPWAAPQTAPSTGPRRGELAATTPSGPGTGSSRLVGPRGTWIGVLLVAAACGAGGLTWMMRASTGEAPTTAPVTPVPAGKTRLAIAPLENISRREEDEWLRLGLAEGIRAKLAAAEQFDVLPAGAMGDSPQGLSERASRLGATLLMTGGFQRVGDELRVTVSVAPAQSGAPADWTVDRRAAMSGLFDLQDGLASDLLHRLQGNASGEVDERVRRAGTHNMAAFEAYARGLALLQARKYLDAMTALRRAVELDPSYGIAESTLARTGAEANHVVLREDGSAVTNQVRMMPADTSLRQYDWRTNLGKVTRAWDLEGNVLEVHASRATDEETAYRLRRPDGKPLRGGVAYEQESKAAQLANGVFLKTVRYSTTPGGEKTFLIQLPVRAKVLSAVPVPMEMSENETGTYLLWRESRSAGALYEWAVAYAMDAAAADRFQAAVPAERRQWFQGASNEALTTLLLTAAEPVLTCIEARQQHAEAARSAGSVVEKAPARYGPFLAALARACAARAEGDDRRALAELQEAGEKNPPDVMTAGLYLDAIELGLRIGDLATPERMLGRALERLGWWEKGFFHRGREGADLERYLVQEHARNGENDACNRDLALLRMRAGDLEGASALLAGREKSSAHWYVLDLQAQIAVRRGQQEETARAMRALASGFPAEKAWLNHASTLVEAGRSQDALDFAVERLHEGFDNAGFQPLALALAGLPHPSAAIPRLMKLLDETPELDSANPSRIDALAELLHRLEGSASPEKDDAYATLFARLRDEIAKMDIRRCDVPCRRPTAERACSTDPPMRDDLRTVLSEFRGVPCGK